MYPWPAPPQPAGKRRPLVVAGGVALILVVAAVAVLASGQPPLPPAGTTSGSVTILGSQATSLDPAVQSDASSAEVGAQVFEALTAVDAAGRIQPALAASWQTSEGGKKIVFKLRPGLVFSDGTPLRAADVVSSWMRVLDPAHPSLLASLLDDVVGARAYREGKGSETAVGLSANGDDQVNVDLVNPSADFQAVVSSPTLGVVPPTIDTNPSVLKPGTFVGSGAYVLSALTDAETTLKANARYWAGAPAIETVHLLNTIGGKSPVSEFQAGRLDYTPIDAIDASWIAFDRELGPDLRVESSSSVEFYGFDCSRPPFDNVHVRRAFQMGIDWRRLVDLLADPLLLPATGMVPPGIPGRGTTDFGPMFDVAKARAELAAAGYANGAGFPRVTLITGGFGGSVDRAVVAQLHTNLGIDIGYEKLDWTAYNERLVSDPPAFWEMAWVADYPGANDFLGLLLGTGKTNNFGRWSSSDFDTAIGQALAGGDQAAMQQAFDRAQAVVLDQAPVIPVDYGSGYSLSSSKLLGAVPNGQGIIRYAGLAWASGS